MLVFLYHGEKDVEHKSTTYERMTRTVRTGKPEFLTRLHGIFVVPGACHCHGPPATVYACIKLYYSRPATTLYSQLSTSHEQNHNCTFHAALSSIYNSISKKVHQVGINFSAPPTGAFDSQSRGPESCISTPLLAIRLLFKSLC